METPRENQLWQRLASLLAEIESAFAAVRQQYPAEVTCAPGCDDCCHACFTVSLLEGELIRRHLRATAAARPASFAAVVSRASAGKAEREKHLARVAGDAAAFSECLARTRIRCPLLGDDGRCVLYEARPVTCRVYGLPTELGGRGHVCGLSGFDAGSRYPTVKLDRINLFLTDMSLEFAALHALPESAGRQKKFIDEIVEEMAE